MTCLYLHSVVGDIVVGTDFRVFYTGNSTNRCREGSDWGPDGYTDGLNRVPEGTRSGL